MKKLSLILGVITVCAFSQIIFPSNSEAGVSCKYDYFGNYVCRGTGNNTGFNSSTRKDYFGNDVTNWNSGTSRGTVTCKYDYFGNYVCN
tara:strand:+ start:244 stop:510 length:267 start_codon:yes stop_codon:yes gene_type:complete